MIAPEDYIENHIQPKQQLRKYRESLEAHRQRHDPCRHDKGEITWEEILDETKAYPPEAVKSFVFTFRDRADRKTGHR